MCYVLMDQQFVIGYLFFYLVGCTLLYTVRVPQIWPWMANNTLQS